MPASRATLLEAIDMFLSDIAEVAGYAPERDEMRDVSAYVLRRPILTVPDPWFFAGLIALESSKICDLFQPPEAAILLREISARVDPMTGRRGNTISRLIFALMGRLGFGAVIKHMKVPDHQIGDVIRLMMGNQKTWPHLLPTMTAHRQVRAALKMGPPSWWQEYRDGTVRTEAMKDLTVHLERPMAAVDEEPLDLSTLMAEFADLAPALEPVQAA